MMILIIRVYNKKNSIIKMLNLKIYFNNRYNNKNKLMKRKFRKEFNN